MAIFTTSALLGYSNRPDVELRIEGEGQEQHVVEHKGTLGGRLARHIKAQDQTLDRTDKMAAYERARLGVEQALKAAYGEEIGQTAFRAGIGRYRNGQFEMNNNYPITGRHIAKMLKKAEELTMRAAPNQCDFGRRGLRDREGNAMPRLATSCWMERMAQRETFTPGDRRMYQSVSEYPDGNLLVHDVCVDLRAQRVEFDEARGPSGLAAGIRLAERLNEDVDAWMEEYPDRSPGMWTLDLHLPSEFRGSGDHIIAFKIDRDQPDLVRVFDSNRCDTTIPRTQLAGFLSAHVKNVYGRVNSFELHRAETRLLGVHHPTSNGWSMAVVPVQGGGDEVCQVYAKRKMETGMEGGTRGNPPLYNSFWKDVNRSDIVIDRGMAPGGVNQAEEGEKLPRLKLTADNAELELASLTQRGLEDDADAVTGLSCLLGQSFQNAMEEAHSLLVDYDLPDQGLQQTIPFPQSDTARNIALTEIVRHGDTIDITYTCIKHAEAIVVDNIYLRCSPGSDTWKAKTTIRVSINELARAGRDGRVPDFRTIVPSRVDLDLPGLTGKRADEFRPRDKVLAWDDAIGRGVDSIGGGDWTRLERDFTQRIGRNELIVFNEHANPVSLSFHHSLSDIDSMQFNRDASIDVQSIENREHAHEQLLLLTQNDSGAAAELSKLVDATIMHDASKELARSIGIVPPALDELFGSRLDVEFQEVDADGAPAIEITFSQKLKSAGKLVPPTGGEPEQLRAVMKIRVTMDDLRAGRAENFQVVEKPHFALAGGVGFGEGEFEPR